MVSVTNGVMCLQAERKFSPAILLNQFTRGKYRRQVRASREHVEVEGGKLYPRDRGYIKAVPRHITHREHFDCIASVHNRNTTVVKLFEATAILAPQYVEFLTPLRHKGKGRIHFFIVSDIAVIVVIETQKLKMVNGICDPPYQGWIQSEPIVFHTVVYFRYVHVDSNAVSTANVIVVVEKVFFSFPRVYIYF